MQDLDSALAHTLEGYRAAVYARDADAFMQLYDPQVRVFDAWGVWSYEGATLWRRAVEGWFASLGSERVKVGFADVQHSGGPGMVVASMLVNYASVSASGEPLRAMDNRLSWGLKLSGHRLRIVHEHSSAPVGFEDMKALLHRPTGQ